MRNVARFRFLGLLLCSSLCVLAGAQSLRRFDLSSYSVVGGNNVTATVGLNAPAPAGGKTVSLWSSYRAAVVPPTVLIPAGQTTASFDVVTNGVASRTPLTLRATLGTAIMYAVPTVTPASIKSVSVDPVEVNGGDVTHLTVTLDGKACPVGWGVGFLIDQQCVPIPWTVRVPPGEDHVTFDLQTESGYPSAVAHIVAKMRDGSTDTSLSIVGNPGLAKSAWPKAGGNLGNTGQGFGRGTTPNLKWVFETIDRFPGQTIVREDGSVLLTSDRGTVYLLNADRTIRWSIPNAYQLDSDRRDTHAVSGPDGTIYAPLLHEFRAIDSNGTTLWSQVSNTSRWGTPFVARDGTVYCSRTDSVGPALYSFAPNGSVKWHLDGPRFTLPIVEGPDGTLFTLADEYPYYVYAIRPDGSVKWQYASYSHTSAYTITSDGNFVAGFGQNLVSIAPSGAKLWSKSLLSDMDVWGAIAATADGDACAAGKAGVIRLGPNGEQRWLWSAPTGNQAHDVIAGPDGIFYLRSQDKVSALSGAGNLLWSTPSSSMFWTSANDTVMPTITPTGSLVAPTYGGEVVSFSSAGAKEWSICVSNGIAGSATYDANGLLYIGTKSGWLFQIGAAGNVRWKTSCAATFACAPSVAADGTIYAQTSNKLFAVRPNGALRWTRSIDGPSAGASPTIRPDGTIVIGTNLSLFGLNPNGSLKWTTTSGTIPSTPALTQQGVIYSLFGTDSLAVIASEPSRKLSGTYIGWELKSVGIGKLGVVACTDSRLYTFTPQLQLISKVITNTASAASLGVDGTIYVGFGQKTYGGVEARSADLSLKWQCRTPSAVLVAPTIGADGVVYVGCVYGEVCAISPTGELLWTYQTGGTVSAQMTLHSDGTLIVPCSNGKVFALK